MSVIKAVLPHRWTLKPKIFLVLTVSSFLCTVLWSKSSELKSQISSLKETPSKNRLEDRLVSLESDANVAAPLNEVGKNKTWLTTVVGSKLDKIGKIDVTEALAEDPELKTVTSFTIDPLVSFFPGEIHRTNPDGTSYENWLAMNFPPLGTVWKDNYNTPCFTNATDGRFRCVPKVYVVGWPKCGTTELWWYMKRHPGLAHSHKKETEFLTARRFDNGHKRMFTFDELLKQWFDSTSETVIKRNPKKILFDGSVSTAYFNWHWKIKQGYAGDPNLPTHTNFHYIRKISPSSRIIALMRNPTTAALSFFNHVVQTRFEKFSENRTFFRQLMSATGIHNYFSQSIQHFNNCVKKTSLRACCHISCFDEEGSEKPKMFNFLQIYIYYIYLEEAFKNFPRSQMQLIKSEEFFEKELSTLQKLFKFLKVSLKPAKLLVKQKNGEVSNDKPQRMHPAVETYQLLSEFYKPFNKRLAKMLGEPIWLKWETETELLIIKMKSKSKN